MDSVDRHRKQRTVWKRVLEAPTALAVFPAPSVFQRRSRAAGWTAFVALALFVGWGLGRVAWHYWVLAGEC